MTYALGNTQPRVEELIPARGDLPAVTVTFRPEPSLLSIRAGRHAAAAVMRAGGPLATERAGDAFSAEVIRHNILAWSGLGTDGDTPVEPTHDVEHRDENGALIEVVPGTISAFLAESRLFEAADAAYVLPWALRDAEKNGWSPSPNGISAGAMPDSDTASSPATPPVSDDADTTTDAPPVPTSDTPRKPKRAKGSGN